MLICPACFSILADNVDRCPYCQTLRPAIGWDRENYLGQLLLDRYEIVQRLGAGATGSVYLAHDRSSAADADTRVAVKFLHRRLTIEEKLVLRFRREALAASQITNEHVARTVAYGELSDGTHFLVMDFVEGRSLHGVLAMKPRLTAPHVIDISLQIAEALEAAHSVGVIHRDLKPANIYLVKQPNGSDSVKVLDFGYALIKTRERGGMKLTKTGLIVGTPTYMSPEQTEGRRDIDGRSDLYTLGVLMYRMLAGRPPLTANTVMELVIKHRTEKPKPLLDVIPDGSVSPDLAAIVMKLLEKRRDRRFATPRAVRQALWPLSEAAQDASENATPPTGKAPPSDKEIPPAESSAEPPSGESFVDATGVDKALILTARRRWVLPAIIVGGAVALLALLFALGVL